MEIPLNITENNSLEIELKLLDEYITMILDTGCEITTIHKDCLYACSTNIEIDIHSGIYYDFNIINAEAQYRVADGSLKNGITIMIEDLIIGNYIIPPFEAFVGKYVSLLGMDILKYFKFTIDCKNELFYLENYNNLDLYCGNSNDFSTSNNF